MQDPVSQRFLECYHLLKEQGAIRSARQFAIAINIFPQSFNEILKGRRDVTIKLLRQACEQFSINSSYVLTGRGERLLEKSNSGYFPKSSFIPVICPHRHQLYARQELDVQYVDHWPLAPNWSGQKISIAFQSHRTDLRPSLESGDILFCRKLEECNWCVNVMASRIYIFVTHEELYIARAMHTHGDEITISISAEAPDIQLRLEDLREIWVPQHKWSSQIEHNPCLLYTSPSPRD